MLGHTQRPATMLQSGLGRTRAALFATFLFALAATANAAVTCVNPQGTGGCFKTITSAVTVARTGDVILVGPGTYHESVWIGKPISLVGAGRDTTTIDAKGLANGIYIDGLDNLGLSDVVVSGFTVENANFEGILVQNTSQAVIARNRVRKNDLSLEPSSAMCPGQPAFETSEAMDCGEGIHLMGTNHSIVSDNISENNSGGILVSDETNQTNSNVITRNQVHDNAFACGITLASHPGWVKTGTAPLAFGVVHNTVSDNDSYNNGLGLPGAGAGVGLFAPGPGNFTTYNSVEHNRLTGNALPGVAVHNHVQLLFPGHPPNPVVNDNLIVGNYISGNGSDGALPTTVNTGISILGVTPITGLVITDNIIENEDIDVATNSASVLDLHLNDLGNNAIGVDNLNAGGTVFATENWWGCAGGPGASGCATVAGSVVSIPWLDAPIK
jgi:nitrous oxidase accessory protein NosD